MIVYIVLVHHAHTYQADVFQCRKDAEERLKRAKARFQEYNGFSVVLLEKWASPDHSTIFANNHTGA